MLCKDTFHSTSYSNYRFEHFIRSIDDDQYSILNGHIYLTVL